MSKVYCREFKFKGVTVPATSYNVGTRAEEVAAIEAKGQKKKPGAVSLMHHMWKLDQTWRDAEGRKPYAELTEREKMLEGGIPWDPVRLKELTQQSSNLSS